MNKNYIKALKNLEPSAKQLTVREFMICSYRWGLYDGHEHTLQETGHIYGMTRERVRQIIEKIKEKMLKIDKGLDKV
jgi:RNA polymerase primary sigma factor